MLSALSQNSQPNEIGRTAGCGGGIARGKHRPTEHSLMPIMEPAPAWVAVVYGQGRAIHGDDDITRLQPSLCSGGVLAHINHRQHMLLVFEQCIETERTGCKQIGPKPTVGSAQQFLRRSRVQPREPHVIENDRAALMVSQPYTNAFTRNGKLLGG